MENRTQIEHKIENAGKSLGEKGIVHYCVLFSTKVKKVVVYLLPLSPVGEVFRHRNRTQKTMSVNAGEFGFLVFDDRTQRPLPPAHRPEAGRAAERRRH